MSLRAVCERVVFGGGSVGFICGRRSRKPKQTMNWPATVKELQTAGYNYQYSRPCKLCTARIEFWETPGTRKLMPMDILAGGKRASHFATCPKAAAFRRKGDPFTAAQPVQLKLL
jgi:hypothetical protein